MNIDSLTYYTSSIPFTDVMTTASDFLYSDSSYTVLYDARNTPQVANYSTLYNLDSNGWPMQLPFTVSGVGTVTNYLFYINDLYPAGTYNIYYEGEGTIETGDDVSINGSQYQITLDGLGNNKWIRITASTEGNYLHNMRILPSTYSSTDTYPTFLTSYLNGLKPFHCIRFMNWFGGNNCTEQNWADRTPESYFSQGSIKGTAQEYAIELCNTLNCDAWINISHMASDDYITQMATLWKNNLNSGLKIHIECSNEIWNFGFYQFAWISNNGSYPSDMQSYTGGAYTALNSYVIDDLGAIGPAQDGGAWVEKDAYMMARVFRLWAAVFTGTDAGRLIRVATGQKTWYGNSGRILTYLFETDANKIGCDAFAVDGYFELTEDVHNQWIAEGSSNLSMESMYVSMYNSINEVDLPSWKGTAEYCNQYGIPYLVYEGGQSMYTYNNQIWYYTEMLYDFQIDYRMYYLYSHNFEIATTPGIDCSLFMAFSYLSGRKSKYGSWGHLESESQVGSDYLLTAPKYQALLDANTSK